MNTEIETIEELQHLWDTAAETMRRPDEWVPLTERAPATPPEFITGTSERIKVYRGLSEALSETMLALLTEGVTIYSLALEEDADLDERKRRPRKRTQICMTACLSIIGSVEAQAAKYATTRALETHVEKRKRRDFKSRK